MTTTGERRYRAPLAEHERSGLSVAEFLRLLDGEGAVDQPALVAEGTFVTSFTRSALRSYRPRKHSTRSVSLHCSNTTTTSGRTCRRCSLTHSMPPASRHSSASHAPTLRICCSPPLDCISVTHITIASDTVLSLNAPEFAQEAPSSTTLAPPGASSQAVSSLRSILPSESA